MEDLLKRLEADPDDAEALAELAKVYERDAQWAGLVDVLQRQAELAVDPDAAVAALLRVAVIQEQQLGDLEGAAQTARKVLAMNPESILAQAIVARATP